MADNPKDATSSAPGSSSVSPSVDKGRAPDAPVGAAGPTAQGAVTSDSKNPSSGITQSTPQPTTKGDASGPQIKVPETTNNPKPVSPAEQKASTHSDVSRPQAGGASAERSQEAPKGDDDWDKPEQVDALEIYDALRASLDSWADEELDQGEDDDNPHYSRHRNVSRALDSGALAEADSRLHEVAEIIASHLNGGR